MNILLDSYLEYQEEKRKEANIIPTAASLLEIATVTEDDWARKVIDGMREHIIYRIKQEAHDGKTHYHFTTKEFPPFVKETVLSNLISIAHQFEDKGFKISINIWSRGGNVGYHFNVSWSNDNKIPTPGQIGEALDRMLEFVKYVSKDGEIVIT